MDHDSNFRTIPIHHLDEVAELLAAAVLRQGTRVQLALQSSQFVAPAGEIALDCGPEESGDGAIEPIRRPRL